MREEYQEFTIGKLSTYTGVQIETIRYYEKIGLLPTPSRSEGRRRLYCKEDETRLVFLRRSREMGFSLAEIRTLLGLVEGEGCTCGAVKALTMRHLHSVREKLRNLRKLEKALVEVSSQCDGGVTQDCPILETLFLGSE